MDQVYGDHEFFSIFHFFLVTKFQKFTTHQRVQGGPKILGDELVDVDTCKMSYKRKNSADPTWSTIHCIRPEFGVNIKIRRSNNPTM